MTLKEDFWRLAFGTTLVGPIGRWCGFGYGEHQLRRSLTDTIHLRQASQFQVLQAGLGGTVRRPVLAQEHDGPLSLFVHVPQGAD